MGWRAVREVWGSQEDFVAKAPQVHRGVSSSSSKRRRRWRALPPPRGSSCSGSREGRDHKRIFYFGNVKKTVENVERRENR